MRLYFGAAPAPHSNSRKKLNDRLVSEVIRLYLFERMSLRQIAKELSVSHMTVYRAVSDPRIEVLI